MLQPPPYFRPGGPYEIGLSENGTDGSKGMAISIEHGGARHPIASIDKPTWQADDFNAGLKMDGRAVLDFMQTEIPTCVKNCLNKNQLNESDVDQFIFHQASKYMLELLIRRMGLPESKVPRSSRRGKYRVIFNTHCTRAPIKQRRPWKKHSSLWIWGGVVLGCKRDQEEFLTQEKL